MIWVFFLCQKKEDIDIIKEVRKYNSTKLKRRTMRDCETFIFK